jgi:aldehyde:ferredoxin oxidoreductase
METWRIDLARQHLSREPLPPTWERLGGRGLLARILLDEVPPDCDPLGGRNKLIFAPGLLVGHMLSSCDRISAGAKSPLTGGVKESNAGGSTGMALALLGIRALILQGQPQPEGWWVLVLDSSGARFDPAGDVAGQGVYDAAKTLRERYGEKVAIALIGPAGEMGLRAAGIANLDKDRVPSRINARGGLGALMGLQRLKAIVVDAREGQKPPLADAAAFKAAQKAFTQALLNHPQTAIYRDFGTAGVARMCNTFGALPVRNFSAGQFEEIESISGEHLRQSLLQRGGEANPSHACMAGCTIRCSNVYAGEDGKEIVSPLEYETIGLMGPNLGISSLDDVGRMNWVVNDLGLDSIDTGAALGVAAEAGLMRFGDAARAMELLGEIRLGTPLGRILGGGAALAGEVLGVRRVPVVKRQAISAYDPRAIKGTGVTYATSPQGADHTAGLTIRAKVDHLDPKVQVEVSRNAQVNMAGYDTLGACVFAGFGFAAAPESIRDLLNARYGWEVGTGILQELGRMTLQLEREFNRRAGFTKADDRLPEWMTEEPLAPTQAVFDVTDDDLDGVFNW